MWRKYVASLPHGDSHTWQKKYRSGIKSDRREEVRRIPFCIRYLCLLQMAQHMVQSNVTTGSSLQGNTAVRVKNQRANKQRTGPMPHKGNIKGQLRIFQW
jgi:hypothetical protein